MELAQLSPRRMFQRVTEGVDGTLLALSLCLAALGIATLFSASYETPNRVTALLLAIPVLLIARQPDLGTAVLVAAVGFYVIFFAGIGWKVLVGLGVLGLAALFPLWGMLHDYQRRRILTLFDPSQDPLGAGYHTIQSTIAVGSGGITGKGWLHGTQTHLEFIPERATG